MPEAVIVATARTPIGRANKGSLVDVRPDDLSALDRRRARSTKVPAARPARPSRTSSRLRPARRRAGLQHRPRRRRPRRACDDVPGVHRQPLLLVVAADDPHGRARDQGRRGRRLRLRRRRDREPLHGRGSSDRTPDTQNPQFAEAHAARRRRAPRAARPTWTPPTGLPDVYIAMGQTAENVAEPEDVTREEMDEFARAVAAAAPSRRSRTGFFEREITPVTLPDGTVVPKDDGPRAGHDGREARDAQAGVPARRHGHRRQRVPAQRRRGRGRRDERHQGRASSASRRSPASSSTGVTALNPEIMGLGPIEASRQALARAGMTIDDIDLVEINEAFAAQVIPSAKHLGIPWDKLNVHGGAIALGHPFGMTGARIMTTLLNGLEDDDKTLGLETMCVGGGQGMAMIVERLS